MPPSSAAQESNYQPRKSSFITGYPQNGAGGMDQAMALDGPKMVRAVGVAPCWGRSSGCGPLLGEEQWVGPLVGGGAVGVAP